MITPKTGCFSAEVLTIHSWEVGPLAVWLLKFQFNTIYLLTSSYIPVEQLLKSEKIVKHSRIIIYEKQIVKIFIKLSYLWMIDDNH